MRESQGLGIKERCENCKYWDDRYLCRRNPPTVVFIGGRDKWGHEIDYEQSEFPSTLDTGWCGEWESGIWEGRIDALD